MPINPLYAKAAAEESGVGREVFPAVKFETIGDKVIGKVAYVGDPWDAPNKFYEDGEPEYKRTVLTQKVVIEKADGTKVSLYLNKKKMFAAIFTALEAANQSDIPVGWTLGFKFTGYEKPKNGKGSPAMTYEARLIKPTD